MISLPEPSNACARFASRRVTHQALCTLLFLVVLLGSGCGSPLSSTVTGKITLDGNPLPVGDRIAGTVTFYPVTSGPNAYADLKSDGSYRLQTGGTSGLIPGEYQVGVRVVEVEPPPPGGYKDAPGQRLLHLARYEDPDLSGLRCTVAKGDQEFNVSLTSK